MPKLLHISPGTVTGIWGHAWRKLPNGKLVPLRVGEQAAVGDQILTSDDGLVRVSDLGRAVAVGPASFVEGAAGLPNLDQLLEREATVAGITAAGDSGSLTDPSLRVARIAEAVSPLSYDFSASERVATAPIGGNAAGEDPTSAGAATSALAGAVTTPEDTPVTFLMPQESGRPTTLNGQPVAPGQIVTLPSGTLTVAEDGSHVIYQPAPDYHGSVTIPFTADGAEIPGTLTLVVTPVPDAPQARPDRASTTEDIPVGGNVLLNDTDVDGDTLRVISFTANGQTWQAGETASLGPAGTLRLNADGTYLFTPAPNYTGPVPPVGYTITDGALTATSTLTITDVSPQNDPPLTVGVLPDRTAEDGMSVSFPTVQGFRDPDAGDRLTYSATGLPPGLRIDPATGVILGTLPADASTRPIYAITVTAIDESGAGVTQTFKLSVTNPAPTALDDTSAVLAGSTLVVPTQEGVITGNRGEGRDLDPDGDILTVTAVRTGAESVPGPIGAPGVPVQGQFGTLTLQPDGSYVYVADRASAVGAGQQVVDRFTYTVNDGQGGTDTAELKVSVTGRNDSPVANDDAPTPPLVEDDRAHQTLGGNLITGAGGNVADVDPDGDPLRLTGVERGAGTVAPTPAALASAIVVDGLYGRLTAQPDGRFEYVLDNTRLATQGLVEGQIATEVFSYGITDGQGGTATATLTLQVAGRSDTFSGTPVIEPILVSGLAGEYYGYNDVAGAGTRIHADDAAATFGGSNLNTIEDLELLINGRSAATGGSAQLLGTAEAASLAAVDAHFNATRLNYGFVPAVDNDLGNNPATAAGQPVSQGALFDFLAADAAALRAGGGAAIGSQPGVQAALGDTSDAAVRLVGQIFLERGNYDFRVTADDGFRLRVGGQTLIEFDGNQDPTTRYFGNVEVSDQIDGLQQLELLYWEQGENARLRMEYRKSSDTEWQILSTDTVGLFAPGTGPDVFDHRVQDIVAGSSPGSFALRTGVVLDGGTGNDTLLGTVARDVLQGNGGDDRLDGSDGADLLEGAGGNDVLLGGAGADMLDGGSGTNRLEGGAGDDFYRLSTGVDTLIEGANGGIDTVELADGYTSDVFLSTLSSGHIENAHVLGNASIGLHGSVLDNRLVGGAGDNLLEGGAGDDRLIGGRGQDTLSGGTGSDTFEWQAGDAATAGAPSLDLITDFKLGDAWSVDGNAYAFGYSNIEGVASNGDRLDLRDLLQGERSTLVDKSTWATVDIGNLLNYLDVQVEGGSTVLRISSTGAFNSATPPSAAADQTIVLDGVDLWQAAGVSPGDETLLMQRLLKNGTLLVD